MSCEKRARHRRAKRASLVALAAWLTTTGYGAAAFAQDSASSPDVSMLGTYVGLAVLPLALVLVTSFVKFSVVLTFLRSALGVQQVLSGLVITALAAVLSAYVMAPVGLDMMARAETQPSLGGESPSYDAEELSRVAEPLQSWLARHTGDDESALFVDMAATLHGAERGGHFQRESPLVLVPAFVLTELKEAFIIGFLILLPFLVVDLVVSNVLLSLGMHMTSPTTISLPFKLLLFVMIDGWSLIVHGLVMGYG